MYIIWLKYPPTPADSRGSASEKRDKQRSKKLESKRQDDKRWSKTLESRKRNKKQEARCKSKQ